MGIVKSLFGGAKPADPVATPAPPTAGNDNTSAATAAQAAGGPGRSANISAGNGPDLNAELDDSYSVRKRLLGV